MSCSRFPAFAREMKRQHGEAIRVGQKAEQLSKKRDKQEEGHPHQAPYYREGRPSAMALSHLLEKPGRHKATVQPW